MTKVGFSSIGSERAPPCINAFTAILSILLRRRLGRSPANLLTAFAQTVVLRSDAMRAHSRIFKQMLILSCAPAAFYAIGNKKCRSKPINSFHAGGRLYLSTAFFM